MRTIIEDKICNNCIRIFESENKLLKTIYEAISTLEPAQWNYYGQSELENPFLVSDNENHKNFIEQYLKHGEKEFVYSYFSNIVGSFDLSRTIHTNSVFFLGCLVFSGLKQPNLLSYTRNGTDQEFYFMWFLTSLLHDYAYNIENNFAVYEHFTDHLDKFKNMNNIENHLDCFVPRTLNPKLTELFKLIDKYYKYRFIESKKIDHGISAGFLLFDLLEKNRVNRLEQQENGVESNNLYWGDEVREMYVQACISIATHNIWKSKEQNKERYIAYGLNALTDDTIYPLAFDEAPFLFFLGLIDSIDPVKIFDCVDADYVLKNLMIEFVDENKIIIRNGSDSKLDFSRFQKKICDTEPWLNISIECEENKSQITIH